MENGFAQPQRPPAYVQPSCVEAQTYGESKRWSVASGLGILLKASWVVRTVVSAKICARRVGHVYRLIMIEKCDENDVVVWLISGFLAVPAVSSPSLKVDL